MAIYNQIGQAYDTTRRADSYIVSRLAFHLDIQAERNYLDVACGTGNYTVALASRGGAWCGVDQSLRMIETARAKDNGVNWQMADITSLPFDEPVFNGAVCTLAIHHFQDLQSAFREVHRVLNSGCFVIFTSTPEQMNNYWLVEYFPEAIRRSAEQMPSLTAVEAALQKAGFASVETEGYQIKENLQDFFLYSGKYQPELYLDAQVRANISTFSLLAEQSEIESGLKKLASDIKGKRIQQIMDNYMETSDYLFVKATL